jgi:uncharacterized protein with PIN domain
MADTDDGERNGIRCPICGGKMYFYSLDVTEYKVDPVNIYEYVDVLEEYRSVTICEGCEKKPCSVFVRGTAQKLCHIL